MRTEADRNQIAKECVKVEKAGGDVLDFLKHAIHSYSPRATWINLQKEVLHRSDSQITDGKPKVKGDERVKKIEKQSAIVIGLMDCLRYGWYVKQYLIDRGYGNPSSALGNAKLYAKQSMPEAYEKIKDIKLSTNENVAQKINEKAPERKSDPVKTVQKQASPTCCQPAKPSGVTVPDMIPRPPTNKIPEPPKKKCYPVGGDEIRFTEKKIVSATGTWEVLSEGKRFVFIPHRAGDMGANILVLDVKDWLNLVAEIPEALKRLAMDELKGGEK